MEDELSFFTFVLSLNKVLIIHSVAAVAVLSTFELTNINDQIVLSVSLIF